MSYNESDYKAINCIFLCSAAKFCAFLFAASELLCIKVSLKEKTKHFWYKFRLRYSFLLSCVSRVWGENKKKREKKIQNCQVKTSLTTFQNHNKHSNILLNVCYVPGTVLSNEETKMKEDKPWFSGSLQSSGEIPTTPIQTQPWGTRRHKDLIQRRIYLQISQEICTLTKTTCPTTAITWFRIIKKTIIYNTLNMKSNKSWVTNYSTSV